MFNFLFQNKMEEKDLCHMWELYRERILISSFMKIYCSFNFHFQKTLMQNLKRNLCHLLKNMTLNCWLKQEKSSLSNKIWHLHTCVHTHTHTPIRQLRDYSVLAVMANVHGFESHPLLLFRSLSIIQAYSKTLHFVSFQYAIFSDKELSLGRKKYGSPAFVKR